MDKNLMRAWTTLVLCIAWTAVCALLAFTAGIAYLPIGIWAPWPSPLVIFATLWANGCVWVMREIARCGLSWDVNIRNLDRGQPVTVLANHGSIPIMPAFFFILMHAVFWRVCVVMKSTRQGNPVAIPAELSGVGIVIERGDRKRGLRAKGEISTAVRRLLRHKTMLVIFCDQHRWTPERVAKCRAHFADRPDVLAWAHNVLTPYSGGLKAILAASPQMRFLHASIACSRRIDSIADVSKIVGAVVCVRVRDTEAPVSRNGTVDEWLLRLWKITAAYVTGMLPPEERYHAPVDVTAEIEKASVH